MFRPICYWVIFVVLNVWQYAKHFWRTLKTLFIKFWVSLSRVLLLLLKCFMGCYFHISNLFFGQSLWVNILKSGSGLPIPSFIDVFVLEQRLQKNDMERFDFFTLLSILLLATCQGLRKTFLFIYLFCNFNFFVLVFKYILTRRYIVIRILL